MKILNFSLILQVMGDEGVIEKGGVHLIFQQVYKEDAVMVDEGPWWAMTIISVVTEMRLLFHPINLIRTTSTPSKCVLAQITCWFSSLEFEG